jgi:hypothetical protein
VQGLADEFDRAKLRRDQVLEESDPRTANETIEWWESALGLPDERVPVIPATLAERRAVVTAAWIARGGQGLAFMRAVCSAAGWTLISLDRHASPRHYELAGESHDRLSFTLRTSDRVLHRVHGLPYAYAVTATLWPTGAAGQIPFAQISAILRAALHVHYALEIHVPAVRLYLTKFAPNQYDVTEWGDVVTGTYGGVVMSGITCAQTNATDSGGDPLGPDWYLYARDGGGFASLSGIPAGGGGVVIQGLGDAGVPTGRTRGFLVGVTLPPAYT